YQQGYESTCRFRRGLGHVPRISFSADPECSVCSTCHTADGSEDPVCNSCRARCGFNHLYDGAGNQIYGANQSSSALVDGVGYRGVSGGGLPFPSCTLPCFGPDFPASDLRSTYV